MQEISIADSALRNKILRLADDLTSGSTVVTVTGTVLEDNSAAILAELIQKTEPLDNQNVMVKFIKDGAYINVVEDTTTPSNNAPLPVKLSSTTGDIIITAGDLNVQLSHAGVNYDSIRIGDGTNLMAVSATGGLTVSTSALPLGAATETTLGLLNAKLVTGTDIGDVTINNANGVNAVNIQDGGNSITVDGTITANLGTIGNIATETTLALAKTDLDNILTKIIAAPATEAKQDTIITALGTLLKPANTLTAVTTVGTITNVVHIDDNAGSITIDATSLPLPTLAATSTKQSDGSQKTQLVDGTGNVIGSTTNALDVNIKSGGLITNYALETGGNLATLTAKDFATQTTLAAVNTKIGEVQAIPTANTILARLKDIYNALGGNPLTKFSIAEKDTTGATYNYYGFIEASTGNWYIMQENKTSGSYKYYKELFVNFPFDAATNAWGARATFTYVRQNTITW